MAGVEREPHGRPAAGLTTPFPADLCIADKPSTWIRKRRGVEFAVVHQPNGAIVNASSTRGTAPSATIEVCT